MPDIRILDNPEELRLAATLFRQAMFGLPGGAAPVDDWASRYVVPGRVYGAWLSGELAGTSNSFAGSLRLPGGQTVAHAAITHVGVLPHFTRKGILSALFSRQLNDLFHQGVAVASLRASQGQIYGRFGFGVATSVHDLQINKSELSSLPNIEADIRLLPAANDWHIQRTIVDKLPLHRAGTLSRWPEWWALQQHRLAQSHLNHYLAVATRQGQTQGFVRYHAKADDNWLYSNERTLVVDDLHAADPQLESSLFSFLLRLDITQRLHLPHRPVDDPLPLLLDNPRAVKQSERRDESWLRVINVETTLNARRYGDGEIILNINDPLLPENHGTWRLNRDGVQRSTASPDISLNTDALAMLILGGSKVWQLAAARRIEIHHPRATSRLEQILACDNQPWSGIVF